MCKERSDWEEMKKKMGGRAQKEHAVRFEHIQFKRCGPRAARNGTSRWNARFLDRKQHITASGLENSTLHEVTAFWGQHSHSLGVKLTPQLDQENARVCANALASMCAWTCVCVCEHTAVFLQWHISPYSVSSENGLTPACVGAVEVSRSLAFLLALFPSFLHPSLLFQPICFWLWILFLKWGLKHAHRKEL